MADEGKSGVSTVKGLPVLVGSGRKGPAALQPAKRAGLHSQGRFRPVPGLRLAHLGWQVSRRMAPPSDALPDRSVKKSGQDAARAPPILNYFRTRKQFSNGIVEGLNNKVKVNMRKSYGFRSFRVTEITLYHSLGKLPEPELTHTFF